MTNHQKMQEMIKATDVVLTMDLGKVCLEKETRSERQQIRRLRDMAGGCH